MKRRITQFIIATFIMMIATVSVAGPLDRIPDARTNPAVDDMLRIPGVVGYTKTEACMLLQQAGLNPVVRMLSGESAKHKGMECKVVKQSPLPGGVAMIGVSVKIDVYAPIDCVDPLPNDGYPEEYPGDEAPWSEGEEQNWTPDGEAEYQPESGEQPGGITQQGGDERILKEKQFRQKAQPKKKIEWKPIPRPSQKKSSSSTPRPERAEERNLAPAAPLKQDEPLKGQ